MNAPRPILEPYRVILDYEALEDGFLDRIEDLNTTFNQIDMAAGFTLGNTQKLLSKSRERWARTLGIESLGKMLKGTGMALVMVVDDERFAPIKEQLSARKRPRKLTNVSIKAPKWLISNRNAAFMRALGVQSLSPRQRKRIAKIAAKARWKKARQITSPAPALDGP
jgi:hypothetical protein